MNKNNTTGYANVSYEPKIGKYRFFFSYGGTKYRSQYYSDPEGCFKAYNELKEKLNKETFTLPNLYALFNKTEISNAPSLLDALYDYFYLSPPNLSFKTFYMSRRSAKPFSDDDPITLKTLSRNPIWLGFVNGESVLSLTKNLAKIQQKSKAMRADVYKEVGKIIEIL